MAIGSILRQILSIEEVEIPKQETPYPPDLVREIFGSSVQETEDRWLVPCTHTIAPPASVQQIRNSEIMLDMEFPVQLADFLQQCNGAKLVVSQAESTELVPGLVREHVRYRLFGTDELVEVNRGLLENFRSLIDVHPDAYPEHQDVRGLNYVAFGDAGNADYYGIGLDGEKKDRVFLVHHELEYRPFLNSEADFLYYTIADNLEDWFRLIVATKGWGGRGEDCGFL